MLVLPIVYLVIILLVVFLVLIATLLPLWLTFGRCFSPSSLFESALKWRGSQSQSPATLLLESNLLCQPRSTRTSPGRRGDGAACVVVLLDQGSQTISDDGGAKRTGDSRSPSLYIVSSISFAQGQTTDSRLLKLLNRRRPPHSLAEGRSLFDARVSNQLVSAGWPPTPLSSTSSAWEPLSLCVRAVRAVVRRRDIRKPPYFADLADWCRRGRGLIRGRGTLWAPQG